mgnify:CR=1 FL=1
MFYRKIHELPAFVAGDSTRLREVLRPERDGLDLPYSLAQAELDPGTASDPHRLAHSTELYLFVAGSGMAIVNGQEIEVAAGSVVLIPQNAEQYVRNTGREALVFFCVVAPPWRAEQEVILDQHPE